MVWWPRYVCLTALLLLTLGSVAADPVPNSLSFNFRFTSGTTVETGTWNLTFNLSRDYNCSDVVYSDTRVNQSSDVNGDFSVYLYGHTQNFSEAYYLCLWRNQTASSPGELRGPYNLSRVPYSFTAQNVSAAGIMDDSNLNISSHNLSAKTTWLDALFVRSWLAPLTDAFLDLGNSTTRFRDLYVSRNLTDGTRFVTVQNLSDAVNVTLDYARINATIGTNATFIDTNTITDPAGLYSNSSLPPGGVNSTHLSNFSNDKNYTSNNSPVNLTPYDLAARYLYATNDTSRQSVLWFQTWGINRGSWFWDNVTSLYSLGTYTDTGAWNGYAFWLNAGNKTARFYGNLIGGGNITGNDTLNIKNITATNIEANLSCTNITGSASNLCTLTDTDTNTVTDPSGLYLNMTFSNGTNLTSITNLTAGNTILNVTNGTTHSVAYSNLTGGPPNFTEGINASSVVGLQANFSNSVNTSQVRGLDALNFSNNVSVSVKNASCVQFRANETILDFCK